MDDLTSAEAFELAAKEADHWQELSATHKCGSYIATAIRGIAKQHAFDLAKARNDAASRPYDGLFQGIVDEVAAKASAERVAKWPTDKIAEYIEEYEFRGDGGDYSPSERERLLIADAIHGVLADDEIVAAIRACAPKESSHG